MRFISFQGWKPNQALDNKRGKIRTKMNTYNIFHWIETNFKSEIHTVTFILITLIFLIYLKPKFLWLIQILLTFTEGFKIWQKKKLLSRMFRSVAPRWLPDCCVLIRQPGENFIRKNKKNKTAEQPAVTLCAAVPPPCRRRPPRRHRRLAERQQQVGENGICCHVSWYESRGVAPVAFMYLQNTMGQTQPLSIILQT